MAEAAVPLPASVALARRGVSDFAVALALVATTTLGFVCFSDYCRHWFVIPVAMCGLLMAIDAVPWARGRMDLYDPAGIVGLLSTHGFFLAPLLNAAWNEWMPMLS